MKTLASILTTINLGLAFNFFPLVPFLGWLNYGHADWATAWIPDAIMLILLPAAYFLYWRAGLVLAAFALGASWLFFRRCGERSANSLLALNAGTIVMYLTVRATLFMLDVRPDIV